MGIVGDEPAKIATYLAKLERRQNPKYVKPASLEVKDPSTITETIDIGEIPSFKNVDISKIPTKEEVEKVNYASEIIKKPKEKTTGPIEEEKRQHKRIAQRMKREQQEKRIRHAPSEVATPKDISSKIYYADSGKYKGYFFKYDFNPKKGSYDVPKKLNRRQLMVVQSQIGPQKIKSVPTEQLPGIKKV
jgi:hypothetical protein